MENIIQKINQKYGVEVDQIKKIGQAEIAIYLEQSIDTTAFAQKLQDNLLDIIDDLSIVKINIIDANGIMIDSFSSNQ
jgi:hypothetical protein